MAAGRDPEAGSRPTVLFDGVCNLCNACVAWLLRRDRAGSLRFAPLQSAAARALLAERLGAAEVERLPDAVILVDDRGVHVGSEAALRIAARLGWPWRAAAAGLVLPRFARDPLYRFVARNRYRWFGRREACMVPAPDVAGRFLDGGATVPPPSGGARVDDAARGPDSG